MRSPLASAIQMVEVYGTADTSARGVYVQRRLLRSTALSLCAALAVAAVALSARGGKGGRPAVLAQASQTRESRIHQLMLEKEEGEKGDADAQEKEDGEDEQQGGIESVNWGKGWGPQVSLHIAFQMKHSEMDT